MAHVTLIRPAMVVSRWAHTTPTCPPIGVAYLASSLLAAGHHVRVIDAVAEAVSTFQPIAGRPQLLLHGLENETVVARVPSQTDMIGLSCMFTHEWPAAQDLLRRLRERFPGVLLMAGGEHITAVPEYSLESAPQLQVCVLGEGEETVVDLATAVERRDGLERVAGIVYRHGSGLLRAAPRSRIRQIDDIPPPAWDLLPLPVYLDNNLGFGVNRGRSMPMLATRGCPYQCTFCSNPTMWTTRWLARKPAAVVAEMEQGIERYQAENFDFYDLTAVVKRSWILEFTQLLIERDLGVTWQLPSGTRSEAIDEDVAHALYRSGCRNLSYAPESGSPAVLKRIKKLVRLDRMKASMRSSIRHGLNVKANIILGFPGETHREMWETLRFICEMAAIGVHDVSISPYSPYPGSELFAELQAAGKIPSFTLDYFYSLIAYSDLTQTVSYNDRLSSRLLGWYRLGGMALFYLVSFSRRPWRVVQMCYHLVTRRHESRLEMSLQALLERLVTPRQPAQHGDTRVAPFRPVERSPRAWGEG